MLAALGTFAMIVLLVGCLRDALSLLVWFRTSRFVVLHCGIVCRPFCLIRSATHARKSAFGQLHSEYPGNLARLRIALFQRLPGGC
jgi:hypothetical protein